jgi:adenylylsulfate kinase
VKKPFTLFFCGLSGAGKTTIAKEIYTYLKEYYKIELLDGDVLRTGLCSDLGFSEKDRHEQIRRIRFLSKTLNKHGISVIVAAITPYTEMRTLNKQELDGSYVEVFVNASLEECVKRDVKGLYKKAIKGEIEMFTGISDRFDIPVNPDIICFTCNESIKESTLKVIQFLKNNNYIEF